MNDHLPECQHEGEYVHSACICDALRACEARVRRRDRRG